jgi:hypothetical protein
LCEGLEHLKIETRLKSDRFVSVIVVVFLYYESIKGEVKTRPINECGCDGIYTSHMDWVDRGTGTPKDKEEVNRREVSECHG